MKYTLTEEESKQVNIGDKLYFIDEGYDLDETNIEISEAEVIGKIIHAANYIQYFIRFVNVNDLFLEQKTHELNTYDLHKGYFKTKLRAINSIGEELQRVQRMIQLKFEKLNGMRLAINPLTYTSKSEASNSPPAKYKYNKRDGSVE
jgi:hypothetical protein